MYPFQTARRFESGLKKKLLKYRLIRDRLASFDSMTRTEGWKNWLKGLKDDQERIRKERESSDLGYKEPGIKRWFPWTALIRFWKFSMLGAQLEIYERIFSHIESLQKQYEQASNELPKLESQLGTAEKKEVWNA